jgi:hypothetical protein
MDDPNARPNLAERYRSATRSSNLKSEPRSTRSDSDVLSAMGMADRILTQGFRVVDKHGTTEPVKPAPLAVPLARLLAGDNGAAREIVLILGERIWRYSYEVRIKVTLVQSEDMARACLAWYRDGVCKSCGGHGYELLAGAPMLSERECTHCIGTGRKPFESEFPADCQQLAKWAVVEMERESGRAATEAMRSLAPRMEL